MRFICALAVCIGTLASLVLPSGMNSQQVPAFAMAQTPPVVPPVVPPTPAPVPPPPTISITPAVTALPGQWVTIKVVSLDGGTPKWVMPPGVTQFDTDIFPPNPRKGIVVSSQTSGVYAISAQTGKTLGGDVLISDPSVCTLTVGAPAPPTPINPPTPVTPPTTMGNLFLLPIIDSSKTAAVPGVLSDPTYWTNLATKGIKYAVLDVSKAADAAEAAQFAIYTAKTGIPALIEMDQTGKFLGSLALPLMTSAIDAEITKLTGGK